MNILNIIILTILFEIITISGRYLFGRSGNYTKYYKSYTKIRIHHMYIGFLLVLISIFYYKEVILNIGLALIISDAIHHLLLKLTTNDYDFN